MCNFRLSHCCCCIELRLGAQIIAALIITLYVGSAIASFAFGNIPGGIFNIILTFPSILLFIGARSGESKRGLILVWLFVHGILMVLMLIGFVVSVVLFIVAMATENSFDDLKNSEWYLDRGWDELSITAVLGIALAIATISVVFQIHAYLVVYSFYMELGDSPGSVQVDPNLYPYPGQAEAGKVVDEPAPMSTVNLD